MLLSDIVLPMEYSWESVRVLVGNVLLKTVSKLVKPFWYPFLEELCQVSSSNLFFFFFASNFTVRISMKA